MVRRQSRHVTRWSIAALTAIALCTAPPAGAVTEVLIPGRSLAVTASQSDPTRRTLLFRSEATTTIAAPFPDPTQGASLFLFASNGSGQCRAEIPLPAGFWTPIDGDGPNKGWMYLDPSFSAQGIKRVLFRRTRNGGRVIVRGKGAALPCGLEATTQGQPIAVALRIDDTRYCAAFGGTTLANKPGKFRARTAAAPEACPDTDLTVATLNVLHGLFCPAGTGNCRMTERMALLGAWVGSRGCPDVVAFQEVFDIPSGAFAGSNVALLSNLSTGCPFTYQVIYTRTNGVDDSLILSRYPALSSTVDLLYGSFRNVLRARIDHPIGPVDVYSTHLASSSDGANNPCGGTCPAACVSAGAATVRECQAVNVAELIETTHDVSAPAVLMGDFNAEAGTFVHQQYTARGWPDVYTAAGNAECVPGTGIGCTSGRQDDTLIDLEAPALNVDERIDFIFLVPPAPASTCAGTLDTPADADGDGTGTRLFAEDPNPFSPTCGPAPDPPCWVSDHSGVQADVNCE